MTGFQHDIAGGNGNLVVTSLQSPNFTHDVSGWQVARDGSAEFNDLTIRGTFFGTDFVVNSLGAFFYSGTPALGNLIASVAPAAGSNDGEGNAFLAGFTVYGSGGQNIEMHISGTGAPEILMPTGLASEAGPGKTGSIIEATGAAAKSGTWLIGPTSTGADDWAAIALFSAAADNSSEAGGSLYYFSGAENQIAYWDNEGFHVVSPGGTSLYTGGALTDVTSRSVVPDNTATQISGAWTIPANDAKAGTVYKITAFGAGTQVASGNNWLFSVAGFGLTAEATCVVTAASIYTGGVAVMYEAWIQVLSTGASGMAHFHSRVTISPNNKAATDANSIVVTGRNNAVTIDTTTAYAMTLDAAINGTVAGANFSMESSYIERIGP